jgi:hypothetical protein
MKNSINPIKHLTRPTESNAYLLLDAHILLAIIVVITATAILPVAVQLKNDIILSIMQVFWIIAAIACLSVTIWRYMMALSSPQQPTAARSAATSSALGSLLCSVSTVMFVNVPNMNIMFIVLAGVLTIVAICTIGIIALVLPEESGDTSPPKITEDNFPIALPSPPAPPPIRPRRQLGPPQLDIKPSEPKQLPSLFEDDPLYSIPNPTIHTRLFIQAKSNDVLDNCEDACAISLDETRFALCDGVSTSTFSRPWAKLLAEHWVKDPIITNDTKALNLWLAKPRQDWFDWAYGPWLTKINERKRALSQPEITDQKVEEFISKGAFSTFLGVIIDQKKSKFLSLAIGDTCLFCFSQAERNSWSVTKFPYQHSSDFSDAPASLTSLKVDTAYLENEILLLEREYKAGDIFMLATDALAKWLLTHIEQDSSDSLIPLKINSIDDFEKFIDEQRKSKELADDDTTLIVVRL